MMSRILRNYVVTVILFLLVVTTVVAGSISRSSALPKAGEFTRRYREAAIKYPWLFATEIDQQIKAGRLTPSSDPLGQNNITIVMNLFNKLRVDNTIETLRKNHNLREFFGWILTEFSLTVNETIFDTKSTDRYLLARNEKTSSGRYYLRDTILYCLYPTTAITGERNYGVTPFTPESKLIDELNRWRAQFPDVIKPLNIDASRSEVATAVAQLTYWDAGQEAIVSTPALRQWLQNYWRDFGWTITQIGAIKLTPIETILKGTDQQQASQRRQVSNALRLFLNGAGIAQ